VTHELAPIEAAFIGVLGGFATYIVVFAMPELKGRWAEFKDPNLPNPPELNKGALTELGCWLLLQLAISGFVAFVFHTAHISVETAACTGMAANGLVAGYARSE
jgi:hypothetical protein